MLSCALCPGRPGKGMKVAPPGMSIRSSRSADRGIVIPSVSAPDAAQSIAATEALAEFVGWGARGREGRLSQWAAPFPESVAGRHPPPPAARLPQGVVDEAAMPEATRDSLRGELAGLDTLLEQGRLACSRPDLPLHRLRGLASDCLFPHTFSGNLTFRDPCVSLCIVGQLSSLRPAGTPPSSCPWVSPCSTRRGLQRP
jgi:hypothetical protein